MYKNCFIYFSSLLLWSCNGEKPQPVKPNVILIMADDLGYGGIGSYGEPNIKTPNIDALAKNGIKFTDFHSNGPVCTPTRAALLTGNYQQRSGLEGVIYVRPETRQLGLDTSQVTIAELLKDNGYATGIMGKWHLGYKKEYNPVYHGFDEFYGYVSGNVDYHSHYDAAGVYDWWHNLDTIQEKGYSTDLITQHSVDFIRKSKDVPFFLYVAHEAPHDPFQGRDDPAIRLPGKELANHNRVEDRRATYQEMVEIMDEGIGKIMETLEENDLLENTFVFFVSDNGAIPLGNNGGLNGQKGNLLEGGHRVPAIVYSKNNISPGESSETLMSMDLLPTFLSITKARVPEDTHFDGLDFSKLLFSQGEINARTIFWRYGDQKAARKGEWKLLITQSDTALYNLKEDLKELMDISDRNPGVVENLVRQLEDWEKEVGQKREMKTL